VRNDLRVLDPIWTTAYVTRNHGYMVFDTLFALDAKFQPQPQMVGDYSISSDKLLYRFALRATACGFTTGNQFTAPIAWPHSNAGWCATLSAKHWRV
jgi:hypothetical protein